MGVAISLFWRQVTKDSLALVTGSAEVDQASGSALPSGPFLSAALPCHPQFDSPHGHRMPAMCFLIWTCFCSAFQARIVRFTLLRVLLDICLLQRSHPICQKMVLPSNFIQHLTPLTISAATTLLPIINISSALLESSPNWSSLLLLLSLLPQPERYFKNISQIMSRLRIFQLIPVSLE